MCGLAGTVAWGDREALERMTDVQVHRGPDDRGVWDTVLPDGTRIGLGSRRLSILDLSPAGRMPMASEDAKLVIAYNGEVYNFAELREELEAAGVRFRSRTDTEVVLRLYEREGPDCVKRLDGIFAFALCDLRGAKPKLFLARDHFGVKPLYYAQRGEKLAFASEAKALFLLPDMAPELDPRGLHAFLSFLWVPEPDTMFAGIKKLPAGHYAVFSDGRLKFTEYWDVEYPDRNASFAGSEEELAEELREKLRRAVRRQLVSDRPVGAFLSAGLDSSSIVALMAEASSKPVKTYTITFPPKYRVGEIGLDDPAVARRVAERFGCEHREIVVEPAVAELLPKLIWHMDDPTADPPVILSYLICREAKPSATVLLSGIGGDELFAGYRKYSAHYWARQYRRLPEAARRGIIEPAVAGLPGLRGTPLKGLVRLAKKMSRSASLPPEEAFLMNCTYFDAGQKDRLYAPALRAQLAGVDPAWRHRERFARVRHADFLNQMLYLDQRQFMAALNLSYNDRMSMASSVEVRVPFLDRELAEFAARRVPPRLKLKGRIQPTTKYLLRKAMAGVLPAEVLRQPKAGFAAPLDYWLAGELRGMCDELLSESRVRQRGLFDPAAVSALVGEHRAGRHDWSMHIWQLLTLELWQQVFIDGGWKDHAQRSISRGKTTC